MTDRFSSHEETTFHPEAESQGRVARLVGFDALSQNPYPSGSRMFHSFMAGWADADQDIAAGNVRAPEVRPSVRRRYIP